ncbi:MAG TPA: hypothetical protein VNZ03_31185 [Terriglobales bacterium]|jgi:hypothetical protein|nr:hypothetical protein [Terriglobales bacterium]
MRSALAAQRLIKSSILVVLLASPAWSIAPDSQKGSNKSASRWEEGQPGCTFSRDDDGKYRYGFWNADFGVVLAVDSQELEKVRRRAQPILALHLTLHYRGKDSVDVVPGRINLEFVKHYHDEQSALDADALAIKEQNDTDVFMRHTEHEIRKHPEKKGEEEATLTARQKDAAEMTEFLKTRSLRAMKLDSGHPEASGWVLFSTRSKWIDHLLKQEEFVLRVYVGNRVVEFPFSLPPSEGDLILRSRP